MAECRSLSEIKRIRDIAIAARAYARAASLSAEVRNYAWEIHTLAERRAGEVLEYLEHGKTGRKSAYQHSVSGTVALNSEYARALDKLDISYRAGQRWRQLAEVPEHALGKYLAEVVKMDGAEPSRKGLLAFVSGQSGMAQTSSDDNEYYTKAEYIAAARKVLGDIDLDPASHWIANEVVKAKKFFTVGDNSLAQLWHGRIWLNPPWGAEGPQFVAKLLDSYRAGTVLSAILLVNAHATDTKMVPAVVGFCVCFTCPRIKYWQLDGGGKSPNSGSVFVYLGPDRARFHAVFVPYGAVVGRFQP